MTTADIKPSIRASRFRVARSRGALSGFLIVLLGLWAALVPFVGPYFDLAFTPSPNSAWHWTAGRGWLEVLPGAVAVLGGLLLIVSASRVVAGFGGWLAVAAGAWLVLGPQLADLLNIGIGTPDPSYGTANRTAAALFFFYAVGAAILFLAALGLGRLSVVGVRDVRAAERRAAAEAEAEREAVRMREAEAARQRELAAANQGVGTAPQAGTTTAMPAYNESGPANGTGRHERTPGADRSVTVPDDHQTGAVSREGAGHRQTPPA